MTATKMLIDCDPGHDDAVAILYAARHLDLLGITTCHGNSTIESVTRNALAVLTLAGLDIPLARGCAGPLVAASLPIETPHGTTGLDGAELPEPDRQPIGAHAVDFMIEQARAHKDELVLAVIGPATNAAMAIRREPRFASWLREIAVMGGSVMLGNVLPTVEFNAWADPEAAAVLFGCGAPIRMVGYDVTSRTGADATAIERLRRGGRVARTMGDLLDFYRGRQRALLGLSIAPLHDVCAVVPYVDESLISYRECHVAVELAGRLTRGMTVCDFRTLTAEGRVSRGAGAANARVAVAEDAPRLVGAVIDSLLSYA